MNFGLNLYNWFLTNAQSLVLLGIVVVGVFFAIKREFTKLLGTGAVLILAIGFVFNAAGVKDLLLQLFNTVFGV